MGEKPERRRGEALENAILEAAWEELAASGYANLTMEAVAARAQTSRPVINRRWPDRANLALAAIRHILNSNPVLVPDLGSIRAELISVLRQSRDRGTSTGVLAMTQIGDYLREADISPDDFKHSILAGEADMLDTIIQRAIARGEIDEQKLTPRIVQLVPDLLRHELLMTRKPVTDSAIAEVIDTIFLPLVRRTH
ncbi:MAG TPA: TetR/AcrR family transcriptional regulator [Devosia sp.]|nr:TetR/AcrR family transcriptional regulator [Devosia sp.]